MCFHYNAIRSSDLKVKIRQVILLEDFTYRRISKLQHPGGSLPFKTL